MKKNSIKFKIFVSTAGILVVCTMVILITLYLALPKYYYNYKMKNIEKGIKTLTGQLSKTDIRSQDNQESQTLLHNFMKNYNVSLVLLDHSSNLVFLPNSFSRFSGNEWLKGISEDKKPDGPPLNGNSNTSGKIINKKNNSEIYAYTQKVYFKDDPSSYYLMIEAPLQPIDEAAKVILYLMPYMFLFIVIIALGTALIYSRKITDPLLTLNDVARRISKLDFSIKSEISSKDEMGELSSSLNTLASNLQKNMDDLKDANMKLKDDIKKQKIREKERQEFVATISHELKSPITSVSGQIEGMLYSIGAYKDRDKYLKKSLSIMKDMEKLVYELLDIYKLESNEKLENKSKINLSEIIDDIMEDLFFFIEEKKVRLNIDIDEEFTIEGDYNRLNKALSNIIINAIKYSKEEENIIIKLNKPDNSRAYLEVVNTGASIDEEHLGKLFEPFYRVEKSRNRKTGGSGLGLYIVKKILELHQFDYRIENIDNGVKFTIQF